MHRRRWIITISAAVLTLVVGVAVWRWLMPRGPNVLLITLDTTRADRLRTYGYAQADTPFLEALAREGCQFENAITNVPLTLPSHSTMHTGLLPPEHGLRINGMGSLPEDIPTLAEQLARQGYRTGAFVGAFVLDKRFGLDRGFQKYDDDLSGGEPAAEFHLGRRRNAARVVDSALEWLKSFRSRPWFCWIHLYDPHHPCSEHRDEFGDRFAGRGYDAELAYVDRQLERLVKTLQERGDYQNTLVVLVGDHGESLGEHEEPGHGKQLYQCVLQVPLLIRWPERFPGGQHCEETVALQELYPTVLDCLEVPKPTASRGTGRSLRPALEGRKLTAMPFYAETWEPYFGMHCAPQQAVIDGGWKYIRSPRPELYDLTKDPHELQNLIAIEAARSAEMETLLKEIEQRQVVRKPGETRLDARTREALKSLGYSGGTSNELPADQAARKLPDIKDAMRPYVLSMEAMELTAHGKGAEALPLLDRVRSQFPTYRQARVFYAMTLLEIRDQPALRQQRLKETVRICRELIKEESKLPPVERSPEASAVLALALTEQGQFDEAGQAFDQSAQLQSQNPKLFLDWGLMLEKQQRPEEALVKLRMATQLDEGMVTAQWRIGEILLEKSRRPEQSAQAAAGLRDESLKRFELATRYNPQFVLAHYQAAGILMSQSQYAAAAGHLAAVAAADANDANARYLWGLALANQKKYAEAVTALEAALKLNPNHPEAGDLLRVCQEQGTP